MIFRRVLLLSLLSGGFLFARQADLEQAWNLAAKGQRDQAVELLKTLVTKTPGDADARLLLGSLLSENGNAAEAIGQLTEAVRLQPDSAETQNALGEAYTTAGNPKAARAPFERAVAIKPDLGIAQVNLGSVLIQAGELAPAAEHLDRGIELLGKSDDAAYAHFLRAKVFNAAADPKSAARQLEEAVALRPNYPEAWSDLGQARKLLQDDSGALVAEKRAVDLNPADAIAQYRLGAEYLRAGQPPSAVDHLREAYRLNPEDQSVLNALQSALRQAGRTEEADELKRKLTTLLRDKDRANQNALLAVKLNNEGTASEKAGNLPGALEKYKRATELYPSHVGIRVNYAVALLRLGKWTEGLDEMHQALDRDPANAKIREALNDALKQAPAGTIPPWGVH